MNFQDEMKKKFLQVAAGNVEPAEWGKWWTDNKDQLEKMLNRGTIKRIMPTWWRASYYWMTKTQSGVASYFHAQGRPVKTSDYYEKKAEEEVERQRQNVLEDFYKKVAPERLQWEKYLEAHPVEPVEFDWKKLLGAPPAQKTPWTFPYVNVRGEEQWKETREELQLRLKENVQAKIVPLAKAYGMKKAGPKTFVKEKNGLVCRLKFIGYFRGGGYEAMQYYICPIYAIDTGILGLPGHICQGENYQKMQRDWGVIQYGMTAVDAAEVEKINRKFDEILTFFAEDIFPEWQKIDSLEVYFAKERQDYLEVTKTGPTDPRTGRPMWDLDDRERKHPWRADDYLFGVWDLLSGREEEGYKRLAECVEYGADFMESCLKERPEAYNDSRDSMAVLYYNAGLFASTKQIADREKRRRKVLEVYEEVCRFMRYYHGLAKRTTR
ncbi:MAG: hypothetical protein HDQ96_10980 [Lachnospiraceae bacterium]|nr:hypothetical protein [Lachnospiraceae bacterium]